MPKHADFFSTASVHITKSSIKILAANMHCKYFLKIAELGHYCSLGEVSTPSRAGGELRSTQRATPLTHSLGWGCTNLW
jgi:hypothetical protein